MLDVKDVLSELEIDTDDVKAVGHHDMDRNRVYRYKMAEGTFIIKLYGRKLLDGETSAMAVARGAGIPVPEVCRMGVLSDGREYLVMTCLPGETVDHAVLTDAQRISVYHGMGVLQARMHGVAAPSGQKLKYTVQDLLEKTERYYVTIIETVPPDDHALFQRAYEAAQSGLRTLDFSGVRFGFCHGDYEGRNVMVDEGEITGVIDFERGHWGNTEYDIAQHYRNVLLLPGHTALRDAFEAGYRSSISLPDGFMDRLRVYILADGIDVGAWASKRAPDYYQRTVNFLRGMMS